MNVRLPRLARLDAAAALYAAVYFACLALRWAGVTIPLVLDVAFFPLGLVVAWANWRNSRSDGLDARTRLSWRLLAIAALTLWVTGSVWTVLLAVFGRSTYGDLVDRAAIIQYTLAITAYLYFPSRPLPRTHLRRFAIDVAFIVLAGSAIAFYMALKIGWHGSSNTLIIVELLLDWAFFVVASVGCMQKRSPLVRGTLVLLLSANLASLVGNYIFALAPTYHSGDPVDGFWFAAWALRWAAVRYAWLGYRSSRRDEGPNEPVDEIYRGNPFAYVLVGGTFALLFTQILTKDDELIGLVAITAIAMGGLLILRQFAELRENRRLVRTKRERESRFTSLVSNSSDVVLLVDVTGLVTYVSPSLKRVFGEDSRIEPGMRLHDVLTPEDAAQVATLLAQGTGGAPRFESRVKVAPGRWREVEAVWSDLRSDPSVGAIVVNCRDVTERNDIERHLRHTQKLDAMGHLAGGLAHDLNNVLAIIRGYTELLRSELEESSTVADDLDQIVKAVDRAASITQKVLAFSRKQPGQRTLLDLNVVIDGLSTMLRQLMKDQVEVRLTLGRDLWRVRADQGQLEQVLVNLATNARDAMPAGGTLEISTENRVLKGDPVDPRSLPDGDHVAVVFRDHGVGMAPEVAARMFEPFFSTKPKDRGIGLGLAIVHGIVTDSDGRILVDSAEGRGTTVTILLPRVESAALVAPVGA